MTTDRQDFRENCDHCGEGFVVTRGSVYEDAQPIGLYLAAPHGCGQERRVHLVVGLRQGYRELAEARSIAMQAWTAETDIQMSVVAAGDSPWRGEDYLNLTTTREEALDDPCKDAFFHVAEHVVTGNAAIESYLAGAP